MVMVLQVELVTRIKVPQGLAQPSPTVNEGVINLIEMSPNRHEVVIQVPKDSAKNHERKKATLDVDTKHLILMY
jgi:hypothetical protein